MFIVPWPWPGTGRAPRERGDHQVGDPARGLDVAGGDRGRGAGVEQAALGRDRPRSAGRRRREGGASGSVSTRTAKKAADLVTESGQLRLPSTWASVPEKSSVRRVAGDRRLDPQARRRAARPLGVVLEHVLGRVGAVGELGERGAGAALGVGEDLRHPGAQQVEAVALGELGQARLADPVRRLLGAQVGEALARERASARRARASPSSVARRRRDHDALFLEACVE